MENLENSSLFAEERKNSIVALVEERHKVTVAMLCEHFKVSPATVRNDLRELENARLLKRTHGGAISNRKTKYELNSYQKEITNKKEKKAIAHFALSLIDDGDTIALDTGTTTSELAKLLKLRKNITVVTNDINIASMLEKEASVDVIVTGGMLRKNFHCLVGPIATNSMHGLNVDKCFIATNGISMEKGLATPNIEQSEVKREMMSIADSIILLCDSSKFGKTSFAKFGDVDMIDTIITDDLNNKEFVEMLRENDINIETVSV